MTRSRRGRSRSAQRARTSIDTIITDGLRFLEKPPKGRRHASGEKPKPQRPGFTLYVRDPWYTDELRLAHKSAVLVEEPMHGFLFRPSSISRVTSSDKRSTESFIVDARRHRELRDEFRPPLMELARANKLFQDFVGREGIVSCARFRQYDDDGKPLVVLWINFRWRQEFSDQTRVRLRKLFARVVENLPSITAKLRGDGPHPFEQLTRILQPMEHLLTSRDLTHFLESLLDASLKAFGITEQTGTGSVFQFDRQAQTLRRLATRGVLLPKAKETFHVDRGEGIVSWVALKRGSLLISDLSRSPFLREKVYIETAANIRSELAIPILAGEELLGVLNFESSAAVTPFTSHGARAAWYAASHAAIACQTFDQANLTRGLLEVAYKATVQEGAQGQVAQLACDVVRRALKATVCEIFSFDGNSLSLHGASYSDDSVQTQFVEPLPRATGGWTEWIRKTNTPVWISKIVSTEDFSTHYWDLDGEEWLPSPSDGLPSIPKSINKRSLKLMGTQLGVPIVVHNIARGVVWMNFRHHESELPSAAVMQMAITVAAEVGLVLELYKYQREVRQLDDETKVRSRVRKRLFPPPPPELPGASAYVHFHPRGAVPLGGDFWNIAKIDENSACYLIGDVMGKGLSASLGMLPLIATFQAISNDSCSAKAIIRRLLPICDAWQLKLTMMCFVIDIASRTPQLSVTTAGHEQLVIAKKDGQVLYFPEEKSSANIGTINPDIPRYALDEDVIRLSSGDVIIAYTDGLFEAAGQGGPSRFRQSDIGDLVKKTLHDDPVASPERLAKAIASAADETAGGSVGDDLTVMVVRIHDPAESSPRRILPADEVS